MHSAELNGHSFPSSTFLSRCLIRRRVGRIPQNRPARNQHLPRPTAAAAAGRVHAGIGLEPLARVTAPTGRLLQLDDEGLVNLVREDPQGAAGAVAVVLVEELHEPLGNGFPLRADGLHVL